MASKLLPKISDSCGHASPQNDLQEFYALISFVTPELLGPMATFKRVYGDPITRSRDKDASAVEKELGLARAKYVAPVACCS